MFTIYLKRQIDFAFWKILRILNLSIGEDYKKLKAYKNIHQNEMCFIIGTGPSLNMKDLETIKGEYSFSVNSIILSFSDTSWRPTYYVIQDKYGYEKLKDAIQAAHMPVIFNGISDKTMTPQMNMEYVPYPLNLLDHGKIIPKHITKFSNDIFKVVYAGHTVVYSAMQLAVYMGFTEIVILGVDCDYSGEVNHFKAYSVQNDPNAAYLMRESYKVAKKYTDNHGIKIINATRNAKLDVFEKESLESILARRQSNVK